MTILSNHDILLHYVEPAMGDMRHSISDLLEVSLVTRQNTACALRKHLVHIRSHMDAIEQLFN